MTKWGAIWRGVEIWRRAMERAAGYSGKVLVLGRFVFAYESRLVCS
jgi:hypothetical protein